MRILFYSRNPETKVLPPLGKDVRLIKDPHGAATKTRAPFIWTGTLYELGIESESRMQTQLAQYAYFEIYTQDERNY